jgi:mRNA interferase MazF
MVTSSENGGWPGDVAVSDLHSARQPAPSIVRCAKIATIEASDAARIGHLAARDQEEVAKALARALAA